MPIEGTFSDLAEAEISEPVWVIKDILPAGIVFLAGPPKTMKSTLEMAFSVVVAGLQTNCLPAEMLQLGSEPGLVMGLSAEATAGELRHMVEVGMRLKVPDDRRILIADDPWSFRLDDPDGLEQILAWLENRKPKLFWLDPLRDFHSLDEKDSGAINRLLRPIQRWAKANGSCFMVVHHTRKKAQDDKSDYDAGDMRGTTALFGIADGVIMITPRQGGKLYLRGTYKRGPEWERTVQLRLWGMEPEVDLEAAIALLLGKERQVLCALVKNKSMTSLIGDEPLMAVQELAGVVKRLEKMRYVKFTGNKLTLTPEGQPVAAHLLGKTLKKAEGT